MTKKNLKEEGQSQRPANRSTRSLGGQQRHASTRNIPPPQQGVREMTMDDAKKALAALNSDPGAVAAMQQQQQSAARIVRPRAAAASNYQRAKSARIIPTPPPAAPAAPSSLNYQRAKSARILPSATPPPPPPPPPPPATVAPAGNVAPRAALSNYQRAKSARILPSAPPPPPPPPSVAKFGNQSLGAISFSGGASSRGLSMQAPSSSSRMAMGRAASARVVAPSPPPMAMGRAASARVVAPSPPPMAMGRAASARMVAPPPPPPPPPSAPPSLTSAPSSSRLVSPPPPPPPPQMGHPPVASSGAAPKGGEKNKPKEKKEKKKKEVPIETFEDELEDVSESEGEEGLTAEERAEKTEKEVRKTLCIALCTACGMVALIQLISWLCNKYSSTEYTGEDELLNAAGNAAPVPPPAGVEQAVNVGIAQQMAVAAGQSAAASSAAGATSAATVAAAAVTVSSVTTTAVTGASAVTLTGVGMATGIVPVPHLFKPEHPCHVFLDEITPHQGHLNLHMKNLPANFFNIPENVPALELAFTEAFNKVLGTCVAYSIDGHNHTDTNNTLAEEIPADVYARFLQNATLEGWNFWYVPDKKGGKTEYFTTEWSAFVGCDDTGGESLGCSDLEPLFYDGDMVRRGRQEPGFGTNNQVGVNTTRRRLLARNPSMWRWLEKSKVINGKKQSNLELFMDSFAQELRAMMEESTDPAHSRLVPDLFYGASLRSNDTNTIVEEEGTKYQYGLIIEAKGSGGAVDRPLGLPICKSDDGTPIATLELKEGYLHLGLQGIDEVFFNSAEETIKELFREVYNDMDSTGCDGYYKRVLEIAEIQGVLAREEQGRWLLSTNWSAMVTCDGCSDIEPLFFLEQGVQGRRLEISSDSQVAKFANAFADKVSDLYQKQSPGSNRKVEAFYAASVDGSGIVVGEEVGERQPFTTKHEGLVDCATGQPPENVDELNQGKFELYVKDLIKDMNRDILAAVMQDVYNDLNGCDTPMQRVAHQLSIDTMEHMVIDNSKIYVGMNMTCKFTCTGCNAVAEPMFGGESVQGSGRRLQPTSKALFERFKAKLTTQINHLLRDYESTMYYQEGVSLFQFTDAKATHKPVDVVYGATYDKSGQVTHYGTPVHNNIFVKEELRAGTDEIVGLETCERDLKLADKNHDHGLTQAEYIHFVEYLYSSVFPDMAPPPGELKNPPGEMKDVFYNFTSKNGGRFFFGDINNGFADEMQRQRVKAICYHTSHAIKKYMQPLTPAPVTSAPTSAPTGTPTTATPTTSTPTSAPTATPTVSAAPTETRVIGNIDVEWIFSFDPDSERKRDATQDEYNRFTGIASNWLTKIYGDWTNYTFESQTTNFVSGKYDGNINIAAITKSEFIFRGPQPVDRFIYEYLNITAKGATLESFLSQQIWEPDGTENPWIFDDMVGLEVGKVKEER